MGLQIRRDHEKDFSSWMVKQSSGFAEDELYSAVRLPCCLHLQISPHCFERNTLQKIKVISIFFEENVKKVETKLFENKSYVRAKVLLLMKRTPYRVIVEFAVTCDVTRSLYLPSRPRAAWLQEM